MHRGSLKITLTALYLFNFSFHNTLPLIQDVGLGGGRGVNTLLLLAQGPGVKRGKKFENKH